MDDLLAQHIAHLFIRDPISLFAEKLEQSSDSETDHFEVIVFILASIATIYLPALPRCICLYFTCIHNRIFSRPTGSQ